MSMAGKSAWLALCVRAETADYISYVEGIVRGYRNTLLTGQNYSNLTQCETIDGNRLLKCDEAS